MGDYLGIAPNTTIVSIKVTDDQGAAYESDLLRGLDWLNQNRSAYHIRVANLSVTTSLPVSYATSPIDAAVEALYRQNVTIVASAGNLGSAEDAVWYAPGNDPLAITVGCLDDNATVSSADDSLCEISSRGVTEDGFAKLDLVAPGRKVVSALATGLGGQDALLAQEFSDRIAADGRHIRLSGTSMSAPVVAGAIALLLERQARSGGGSDSSGPRRSATRCFRARLTTLAWSIFRQRLPRPSIHQRTRNMVHSRSMAPSRRAARTLLWDGTQWANAYWSRPMAIQRTELGALGSPPTWTARTGITPPIGMQHTGKRRTGTARTGTARTGIAPTGTVPTGVARLECPLE